jgi:hypothetical protein
MLACNRRNKAIKVVEASLAKVSNAKYLHLEFGRKNHILILILLSPRPKGGSQKITTSIPSLFIVEPEQETQESTEGHLPHAKPDGKGSCLGTTQDPKLDRAKDP